jgi:HEAT repeat protein
MLLKKEDSDIKHTVLNTLISFKKTGNMNALKHLIKNDPDPKIRVKAVYAIGVAGDGRDSVETLREALLDGDYRVRGEACHALGFLKKSAVSDILINQINTDKSRYVRTAALYSIVKINDSRNVIRLFDIYAAEEDRVFRELLRGIIRDSIKKRIR